MKLLHSIFTILMLSGSCITNTMESGLKKRRIDTEEELYKPNNDILTHGYDSTPLMRAAWHGDVEACTILLKNEITQIDKRSGDGSTALHWAVWGNSYEVCKLLLDWRANPDLANNQGKTPLMYIYAAERAQTRILHLLIACGANKDMQSAPGRSALMQACINRDLVTCRVLLKSGAKTELQDYEGNTALRLAVECRSFQACKLLLDSGAVPLY